MSNKKHPICKKCKTPISFLDNKHYLSHCWNCYYNLYLKNYSDYKKSKYFPK